MTKIFFIKKNIAQADFISIINFIILVNKLSSGITKMNILNRKMQLL